MFRTRQAAILGVVSAALCFALTSIMACQGDDEDMDDSNTVPVLVASNPADGSTVPPNGTVTLTFDNPPTNVTVNGTAATVTGKTATWTAPGGLSPGEVMLSIAWDGGSGTITYTVVSPGSGAGCSDFGEACETDADCCGDFPCQDGVCV